MQHECKITVLETKVFRKKFESRQKAALRE